MRRPARRIPSDPLRPRRTTIRSAYETHLCVPWNRDDPRDLPLIEERLRSLLSQIATESPHRVVPTVAMAQEWHRVIHAQLHVLEPYYAGEIRNRDPRFPCLVDYEVRVGAHPGVPAVNVPAALDVFEQ